MLRTGAINLILKIGLILSSIVFAVFSFIDGARVIPFYPDFVINIIGESTTLILGSLAAICLAIWLLSRRQRFAAVATYLFLLTIGILFNLTSLTFLGMVWPLWCISFALALRYYPRIRVISKDIHGRYVMKIIPAATAAIIASDTDIDTLENKKTKVSPETSTPVFTEANPQSDRANKHALAVATEYEISHDVDATLEEVFSHAGIHNNSNVPQSVSDEIFDDVIENEQVVVPAMNPLSVLDETAVSPLEDIVPADENPRITKKRARAKTGPKTGVKTGLKKKTAIKALSAELIDDIEDIQ